VRPGASVTAVAHPGRRAFAARLIAAAVAASLSFTASARSGLGRTDWQAIRRVITRQLAALRAGDGARAFSYASPAIRNQFGDAPTFLAMVRDAYGALLVARYTEFLDGAVIDGIVIQPLRLIAPDNTVQVALYSMQKLPGGWRVSGCRLAPSTVQAA
jgi:hypothetical protein